VFEFTLADLSRRDGRDGAPAYIACDGLVYDVTASYQWRGGRHQVRHRAGVDLSASLAEAPHGAELLTRVPLVGRLAAPDDPE
jgi:predicted heme/steroid binding protein